VTDGRDVSEVVVTVSEGHRLMPRLTKEMTTAPAVSPMCHQSRVVFLASSLRRSRSTRQASAPLAVMAKVFAGPSPGGRKYPSSKHARRMSSKRGNSVKSSLIRVRNALASSVGSPFALNCTTACPSAWRIRRRIYISSLMRCGMTAPFTCARPAILSSGDSFWQVPFSSVSSAPAAISRSSTRRVWRNTVNCGWRSTSGPERAASVTSLMCWSNLSGGQR